MCTFPGHAMAMNGELLVLQEGPKFTELNYQLFPGDWNQLPNFDQLTPHRSGPIAVGYPNGVNLCYDAGRMTPALFWQGAFMDAKRHWTGRGNGPQPPLGYDVFKAAHRRTRLCGRSQESDYYPIQPLPNPQQQVLEVGALTHAPDGRIFAATRRGDVSLVWDALGPDILSAKLSRYASGLHECPGLAWKEGSLYVTQRPEITRLVEEDSDGRADLFETFSDGWGITGDYHESFGSEFDRHGDLWVALCLTGSFSSQTDYRGWALRVSPDGKTIPTVCGLRSSGGIGYNAAGDAFYTDNQGPWNGSISLK